MSDLLGLGADVEWPDSAAGAQARAASGHLGAHLADLVEWLAGAYGSQPPPVPAKPRLVRIGTETAGSADNFAADAGVGVRTLAADGFEAGVAAADDEVDGGADLLLVTGPADPDSCALAVCALTGAEPVAVLPRGAAAVDTTTWIARAVLLRDRRRELTTFHADPDGLLQALADPALATAAGAVARAAARRTPLLLDGDLAVTAALLVHRAQPRAAQWWRAADTSRSTVQGKALATFGQRPVLDLGIDSADGLAALLALAAVRTAAALADGDTP